MAAVRQISLHLSHVFALEILIGNFEDQDWVVGTELGITGLLTLKNGTTQDVPLVTSCCVDMCVPPGGKNISATILQQSLLITLAQPSDMVST